jgi:hypothetical protein
MYITVKEETSLLAYIDVLKMKNQRRKPFSK